MRMKKELLREFFFYGFFEHKNLSPRPPLNPWNPLNPLHPHTAGMPKGKKPK